MLDELENEQMLAAAKAKAKAEAKATAPSSCSAWAPPCRSCMSHVECQRKRVWLRSEWIVWIRGLRAEGFGRWMKTEWQVWFELEDAARREAREEDRMRGAKNLEKLMEGPPRRGMPGYASDQGGDAGR